MRRLFGEFSFRLLNSVRLFAKAGNLLRGFACAAIWVWALVLAATCVPGADSRPAATQPSPINAASASLGKELIGRYCVTCHNQRLHTAGLKLDQINLQDIGTAAPVLEKIVRKLRAGEMPPSGMPRPDRATTDAFVSWLETTLDQWAVANPNPGRVVLHRLNRAEYANAIRDLLDLDVDTVSTLPPDDADQQGFENIAGVLSVSPGLLEGYMSAAERISRFAVGDPAIVPVFNTYSVSKTLGQDDRMSEDLPFGSRGGIAVHYYFPVDGEYVVKVRLRRQLYDYIVGLGNPQRLQVSLDGKLVKEFAVGGEDRGIPAPATFVGAIPGDPEWEDYLHSADQGLETRFVAKAGARVLGVSFVKEAVEPEGVMQSRNSTFGLSSDELIHGNAAVDNVAIGGPFQVQAPGESRSRRRIFLCHPSRSPGADTCAEKIIANLARRAYRRPLNPTDLKSLLSFYRSGQTRGGVDAGIQLVLQAILSDPEFFFRAEDVPVNAAPGTVYRLNDLELASRLSFFLWSSVPDDALLDAAVHGKLRNPAVLESEVKRMFADKRSKALVDNFAVQWLDLRKIRGVTPDQAEFPGFDDGLREAFEKETKLFLESQIRGDHSVKDLLDANYTFANEQLAQYYGIPNVYGSHFRQVPLTSGVRRGLLGQASILTLTSYPNRTSPVLRGKWLLDNVLGTPPPPPPPDVPPLNEGPSEGKRASVRERMEQHRKSAACAVCHVRMDPLGFALENFDAIGRWRTMSDGKAVDASASMPDGTKFEGAEGLRKLLLSHSDQFVRTVTEKLLSYALGRELAYYDAPAVRQIMREAASSDDRWSAIVLAIAKSVPFQMSRVEAVESQARSSKR
jgi:mono/diheme cytochrome c family protein